ncbi:peptidoglycan DD-metalloendopeptidase family protein [Halomonas sp. ML-15]|uniref:peptidoglycan DD-metalloendopeptidase family protein n=1 Tax=Halomonas sp. ML-15 TaxID=2773305 RepID=UPI001746CBEA|nr:peptidoglycan DD-metalloendopeptidase family protein [Halomonas sp. ML-15]MBD3898170.1 peptidoglycan DD-metalloendopeptidase family protein [Halomonas sp. ML-15]
MRKALLVSAVTLAMTGCAAQQGGDTQRVQVRDLTMSREQSPASQYTVEAGDTLYGIAWRHDMDFRELAQLNDIGPPYRLQPGQELRLAEGAQVASSSDAERQRGAQVTGAVDVDQQDGDLSWLAPDEETIERNRRLTAQPLEDSGTSAEALGGAALAGADEAPSDAPGPLFDYSTPGADGSLSERDQAEREALAREQAEREQAERDAAPSEVAVAASEEAQPEPDEAPRVSDTQPSSTVSDTQDSDSADAGAAVAGQAESASSERSQRSYTPVDEVDWQWPAEGELIGRFGEGESITAGIDIGGQKGQPVKAAGPGIVVYAGSGVRGYGNLILLKHNDEYLSAYAHNDTLSVAENDVVDAGEVIATMGDTDADSVKLHFEVRRNGQPQDPLEYLPSR